MIFVTKIPIETQPFSIKVFDIFRVLFLIQLRSELTGQSIGKIEHRIYPNRVIMNGMYVIPFRITRSSVTFDSKMCSGV